MGQSERVPDLLVEQLMLGELSEQRATEVERRLRGEVGGSSRMSAIHEDTERFFADGSSEVALTRIRQRVELGGRRRKKVSRVMWAGGTVLAVAAAWSIVAVLPSADPFSIQDVGSGGWTATKGDPLELHLYRKMGESVERLRDGDPVAAGDTVQIAYVAHGATHGVILSVDGAGVVMVHHPHREGASTSIASGGEMALPHGYRLDDAPSFERFFFVAASEPVDVDRVVRSVRVAVASGSSELVLPEEGYRQASVLLVKEER